MIHSQQNYFVFDQEFITLHLYKNCKVPGTTTGPSQTTTYGVSNPPYPVDMPMPQPGGQPGFSVGGPVPPYPPQPMPGYPPGPGKTYIYFILLLALM